MPLTIGLDLGTTSISTVAVDNAGRVVRSHTVNHGADVPGLPAGHAEQDPLRMRDTALTALRQLAEGLSEPPVCLGLTGQMHGVLLLDHERRPVSNLITWQDRRALEPHPVSGEPVLQTLQSRADTDAIARSGCRLSAGYLGTTLYALRETDQLPDSATRAALIIDWLASQLTGDELATDRSNAASTGLYDLEQDRWSPSLLAAAKVGQDMVPRVAESGEVIGRLTKEAAQATGLPVGLPVCNAIGDNQAAIVGSVPVGDQVIQINVGTGGQISWAIDRFLAVPGMETRYLPHGRFLLVGAGLAGGDAYAWVKRTTAAWLTALGVPLSDDEIYQRLDAALSSSPADAAGLVCEPYFRGTRRNPAARGLFQNITADNFTPGNVSRAVLRGIADGMRSFLDLAGDHRPQSARRIVATGNAVRRNPALLQMLAEAFRLPVDVPVHVEEAAYGAAIVAGSRCGLWSSLETAGGHIRHKRASDADNSESAC